MLFLIDAAIRTMQAHADCAQQAMLLLIGVLSNFFVGFRLCSTILVDRPSTTVSCLCASEQVSFRQNESWGSSPLPLNQAKRLPEQCATGFAQSTGELSSGRDFLRAAAHQVEQFLPPPPGPAVGPDGDPRRNQPRNDAAVAAAVQQPPSQGPPLEFAGEVDSFSVSTLSTNQEGTNQDPANPVPANPVAVNPAAANPVAVNPVAANQEGANEEGSTHETSTIRSVAAAVASSNRTARSSDTSYSQNHQGIMQGADGDDVGSNNTGQMAGELFHEMLAAGLYQEESVSSNNHDPIPVPGADTVVVAADDDSKGQKPPAKKPKKG